MRHPFDSTLELYGWKRLEFEDLRPTEEARIACRLIILSPFEARPGQYMSTAVNLYLWRYAGKVRLSLVSRSIPPTFEIALINGRTGIFPRSLGLTVCKCPGERWNPFILPLAWRKDMKDGNLFDEMSQHFAQLIATDNTWLCQNPDHLQF